MTLYTGTILKGRFKLSDHPFLVGGFAAIFEAKDMYDSNHEVIVKINTKKSVHCRELETMLAMRAKNLIGFTDLIDYGKVNAEKI